MVARRAPGTAAVGWAVDAGWRGGAGRGPDYPHAPLELGPGEGALARGGPDHHIAHEPAATCLSPEQFRTRHAGDERSGDRRASVFLCGAYRFSGDVGRGLIEALPPILPLSAAADDPLPAVIPLLSRDLAASAPGQQPVLDRLLDVLLVPAMRACFQRSANAPRWYRASADPRLSPALSAMHADAAHPWTVPELAAVSGLSRATFARSFQQALGQAPMQYLTDWRVTLARDPLPTAVLPPTHIP